MTRPNRFNNQESVVIHGKAYTRSQVFGIKSECYLALRKSSVPPHVLEKYDGVKSSAGPVIVLKNIIVNPSGKRGFDLISSVGVLHHFFLESEALATLWIKNLQNLSSFEPLNSLELYSDVVPRGLSLSLHPSDALNYHGRCYFVVSDNDICLHDIDDNTRIVVSWPLSAVRSYGISKRMFTLKTGRSTVTGRAEFVFDVSKPLTPFHVYQEVASKVHSSQLMTSDIMDPLASTADTEIVTGTHDADYGYDQPTSCELLPDSVSPPEEPAEEEERQSHTDSEDDEESSREVVYTRLPLVHSVTCQLPSKSFPTVFGLDDTVSRLKNLLGRESRFRNCSVLLYGPSDSGKRTLANALAMESEVRFVCLDCESLARKLVADDLPNLRDTVDCILTLRPCVVFVEHVEVVLRGFECPELGSAVLKAVLKLLDRASSKRRFLVVLSTSCPQSVEDCLRTRSTEQVYVPLPSSVSRLSIFRERLKLSASCSEAEKFAKSLVRKTAGCSVAQILELCGEVERANNRNENDAQSCATTKVFRRLKTVAVIWLSEHVNQSIQTRIESIKSSAEYFVKQSAAQDTFLVTLEDNRALPATHSCFLKVTSSGLELRDLDPSHLIVSWSRKTIRGFGTERNLFNLETGRSSSTGEAFFNFITEEADAIQKTIETKCSNRQNPPDDSSSSSTPVQEFDRVV